MEPPSAGGEVPAHLRGGALGAPARQGLGEGVYQLSSKIARWRAILPEVRAPALRVRGVPKLRKLGDQSRGVEPRCLRTCAGTWVTRRTRGGWRAVSPQARDQLRPPWGGTTASWEVPARRCAGDLGAPACLGWPTREEFFRPSQTRPRASASQERREGVLGGCPKTNRQNKS